MAMPSWLATQLDSSQGSTQRDAQWVRIERTIEPDERTSALYREYYELYRRLYADTSDLQHRLAALGQRYALEQA